MSGAATEPAASAAALLADFVGLAGDWPAGGQDWVGRRVALAGAENPRLAAALWSTSGAQVLCLRSPAAGLEPAAVAFAEESAGRGELAATLLRGLRAGLPWASPEPLLAWLSESPTAASAAGFTLEHTERVVDFARPRDEAGALDGLRAWAGRLSPGCELLLRAGRSAPSFAGCAAAGWAPLPSPRGWLRLLRESAVRHEYPHPAGHPQVLAHSAVRYAFAAGVARGRRVLDAGCGAGLGSRRLLAAGAVSVLGVDRDAEALALAASIAPGAGRLRADLGQPLPLADGTFDLVVAFEVLEHLPEPRAALDGWRRLLAPDGLLVLSVPSREYERDCEALASRGNPWHRHAPDEREWQQWLGGFAWREEHVQADLAVSAILPRADGGRAALPPDGPDDSFDLEGAASAALARTEVVLPAAAALAGLRSHVRLAICGRGARVERPAAPAQAFAWHQARLLSSIAHGERLAAELRAVRFALHAERAAAAWASCSSAARSTG